MMNWLRNIPGTDRKKTEPGATFTVFEQHWSQALEVMRTSQDCEGALTVISYLTQMISLLRVSRADDPEQSCRSFWIQHQCSDKVLNWLHHLKNKGLRLSQEDDERLVLMLHALCELAYRDGEILGYVRTNNEIGALPWDGAWSLASMLLEYSLGSEPVLSETSKHSFILLIKLASRFPALEESLSQENGIGYTNLVISGLCACFAQLPTTYQGSSEQLRPFIQQLKFVDDIAHAAPTKVACAIAECFQNSFLDAIIKSALTQDEGTHSLHKRHDPYVTSICEEEAIVTKYLQTMCELVTHPFLVQRLITFTISMLQPTLLQHITHANVSITVSTLSLLNSVLGFYCEDFWFESILKYLLPQNHRMVLQRKTAIADVDFHDSSIRFLALIPTCIMEAIGSEHLTHHYVQYLNNESRRLSTLDSIGLGHLTPTVSAAEYDGISSTKPVVNPVYPNWKLKYDGTDELKPGEVLECSSVSAKSSAREAAPALVNGGHESDSTVSSQDAVVTENESLKAETPRDPLEPTSGNSTVFTNISLHPLTTAGGGDDMSSIGLSEQSYDSLGSTERLSEEKRAAGIGAMGTATAASSMNSDGYASMFHIGELNGSSSKVLDNPASFGPFLDCLLQHLASWTQLDPDVLLMVSEILSTIAASRIPLVSSLFLDPTLILQPSYISFASLLNRIRSELDASLRQYPAVVQEVWNTMSRGRRSSTSSTSSILSSNLDTESISSTTSFGDNIWKKVQGAKFSLFGRSMSGFGSSPAGILGDSQETLQPIGGQGYRYTNFPLSSPPQGNPCDPVKLMASRAIFFSHWLLELAAISQQLCWKMT